MVYECGGMHSFFPGVGYGLIYQIIIFSIFFLIVWWLIKGSKKNTDNSTPLEILKKRLAKGDISKKEFEDLKKELDN